MKKLFIFSITGLIIFLMYQYPSVMLNPGELVSGHQDVREKCSSCHQPFWGIENDRCISCHKPSEIGLKKINPGVANSGKQKILFHDKLINPKCASCHTDHKGVKPDVSLNSFSHELLSAAIINKCNDCHVSLSDKLHSQLSADCSRCHSTNGWKSSVTFSHDMIQTDKNNCISCHQRPNDAFHQMSEDNCSKCHSTSQWIPSTFDHSSYFQLDKDHNSKCNVCHANNNFKTYTCYGCHEHSQGSIMEKHTEEGISDFENCVSCHKSSNEHDIRMKGRSNEGSEQKRNKDSEGSDRIQKNDIKKDHDKKDEEDED